MKRTPLQLRTAIRTRHRMKRKRVRRNEPFLAFIRALPCMIPGCCRPAEAAHVRFSDAAAGKVNPGMGRKDDRWVLPLCAEHHRTGPDAQHGGSERDWWTREGIDPLERATALWAVWQAGGDHEQGLRVVRRESAA